MISRTALAPIAAFLLAVIGGPALAQTSTVRTSFIHLAYGVPGVLYEPSVQGPKAATAVFIMHSSADYLAFPGCFELARRGFRVLCANNSTGKAGVSNDGVLDRVLLDAKAGVAWLRGQPGVKHVVLLGHSGGGTVMSAYQMIAEEGVAACQGPEKIWRCPNTLVGLPSADGLMMIDSNWGLAEMTLFSVDPAVPDEDSGMHVDPKLDMYNPANGFVATGSAYPSSFIAKFLTAEGRRYTAIAERAQARLNAIAQGSGRYDDDEAFVVPGASLLGGDNKLFSQDTRLMAHTRRAWPLLRADGSAVTQVVHSVRIPENPVSLTPSFISGALKTTVRGYLSTYAIRVTSNFGYGPDSVHGIEWTSSYASPPGNVQRIKVPLLVMGMTGHWEYLAAETIHDMAASNDKTLVFVEGALHGYDTCLKCERRPGEFGDTQNTTYDYIDHWLSDLHRFP